MHCPRKPTAKYIIAISMAHMHCPHGQSMCAICILVRTVPLSALSLICTATACSCSVLLIGSGGTAYSYIPRCELKDLHNIV